MMQIDGSPKWGNQQRLNEIPVLKPKPEDPRGPTSKYSGTRVKKRFKPKSPIVPVEVPKTEIPKVETRKAEAPKAETPKLETPKVVPPKVDTPASTVSGDLQEYPDATQLTARFLQFEDHARPIEDRHNKGGELSLEEGETLKAYDVLRDRLAFLRPARTDGKGEPVAMARLPPDERGDTQPAKPAAAGETVRGSDDGGPTREYIGGVRIKNDYSVREVLGSAATALKSPLAGFVASATDLVGKATRGEPLTADEEQKIFRYAGIVDAFLSMTPGGSVRQLAGIGLDALNSAIDGEMKPPEGLTDDLVRLRPMVNPVFRKAQPKSDPSVDVAAKGKEKGGNVPAGTGSAQTPAPPPSLPRAPVAPASPAPYVNHLFDFPRFRVPPSFWPRTPKPTSTSEPKPLFNPPTRLDTGQTGYVLSPTRPPRLPPEKGEAVEPGSAGHGVKPKPVEKTCFPGAACVTSGESPAHGAPGPAKPGTARPDPAEPGGELKPVDNTCFPGSACATSGESPARGVPVWAAGSDLKRMAGKGPISLLPAADAVADRAQIERGRTKFFYYREDRDVKDMQFPRPVRKTDFDMRRDVLTVGTGDEVTSYVADSKVYMGKHWGHGSATLPRNIEVIQLANGRDGVGAIELPFANIARGSTVVVTGGAMNGCTMLFGADKRALYAYHAGTSSLNARWHTSSNGARSIADAHDLMGPRDKVPHTWHNMNIDLVTVGRQYPFSALIYNARDLTTTKALTGAAATAAAVAGAADTVPNAALHVPRHAFGPRLGRRWQMMTFNYSEPDEVLRSIGTAQAIVSKDERGAISVSVLAERGTLDKRASLGERGDAIAYRYTPAEADSATWFVPVPEAR